MASNVQSNSRAKILTVILIFLFPCSSPLFADGVIKGIVLDRATRQPLPGANICVLGTNLGTATGVDGRFVLPLIPSGTYSLEASLIGYQSQRLDNLNATSASLEVSFELMEAPVPLSEVIVTPGHFAIMQNEPAVRQTLTREEISTIPHFGEDIYRAIQRLPGVSGNDFSAKFTVRGGENEEVLVLLDGMELYKPFHLNDIGGGLSIVDVEAIGGINLMTGGFPAEYGDKLSGVFDMSSATPDQGKRRTALGISFMNARFMTEGQFKDGRGHWLLSVRRGYIDLVLKLVGEEETLSPDYYDVLGKVQYQLNQRHLLAANVLQAGDQFDLLDKDESDFVNSGYGNTYGWLTLKSFWSAALYAQTVLSIGRVSQDRKGVDFTGGDREVRASVDDVRDFYVYGLKQDWSYDLANRHFLKWGFDAKRMDADYDYFNRERTVAANYDTTDIRLNPSGKKFGAYLADRVRLFKSLTAEIGLRYDYNSYTHDENLSPRLNLAYAIGRRSVLRAGWGRFYQTQGIHELEVQDGDSAFYPAELAEHRVIGFEHAFANGVNVRLEAYQKQLSDLRPQYHNLIDVINVFPEVEQDRILFQPDHGEAKGLEIFLKRDAGGKFSWWGSYGFAFAEDQADGQTVPRNFDQRHTVYFDFNYRPNPQWRLNTAWQYHSGWPYTNAAYVEIELPDNSSFYQLVYGPRNAERLPAYHRLDVRANRYFDLGKGRLSVFLEVINLYNRANVRAYEHFISRSPNGQIAIVKETQKWLPRLPSIGISWEF